MSFWVFAISSGRARAFAACVASVLLLGAGLSRAADFPSLDLPQPGARTLQILSPTTLELAAIVEGSPEVPGDHTPTPPPATPPLAPEDFAVTSANGKTKHAVRAVGFRRRPVYAPVKQRDLRIGNYITLELASPIEEGARVEVSAKSSVPWFAAAPLAATAARDRLSPEIHVSQIGYAPEDPKYAIVGYFLGSLRELTVAEGTEFEVLDAAGKVVHHGKLIARPDRGMPFPWYRQVREADFSALRTPGEYRVRVAGLGVSYPFRIDSGVAATLARTYALGLYHQRCGEENALPFTRFTHDACHTAPVEVPPGNVRKLLGFDETPDDADLFPYVRKGKFDARGGHHDAGDYSKYTINSAALIHHLVFAADAFPGVAELDNLGLPESGDGKSDILQIAKWEADFLAKMQDEDGGFYFLVYPRDRRYEYDVLPDHGDPQIVWPKNTAGTAAAVAALAQCASSPKFRALAPEATKHYLEAAKRGWAFLQAAEKKYGRGGAYRKFTHYGDLFGDDDEIAWAACELFLATGDPAFETELRERLDPRDPKQRRWGWWRMVEGYGCATRSYAFAARSGRLPASKLDRQFLLRCEDEIIACADDWERAANESAYAVSYPEPTKRVSGGGWFFASDKAFDLAVACQLPFPQKADRRPAYRAAIATNFAYDLGCNPQSVAFVTGLGWKRRLEIVHHVAQNDRRALPPSGIPLGSIIDGFSWTAPYKGELGSLCYPLDGAKDFPYPILDRGGDVFNLQTEFVVTNSARALATAAWLMAQSPAADQKWRAARAEITGIGASAKTGEPLRVKLKADGVDLTSAQIVWEGRDLPPVFGRDEISFTPRQSGAQWLEAEALLPDGRRVFGVVELTAR